MPRASTQTFDVVYKAEGPGIATQGGVLFQISPFFGWSDPQSESPELPGYVSISTTSSATIATEIGPLDFVIARIAGGTVRAGETISLHYANARVDRFSEKEERFYVKVDGNGDGYFTPIAKFPWIEVVAGDAARLVATASSFPRDDGAFELRVAALDEAEDRAPDYRGKVTFAVPPEVSGLPPAYAFTEEDAGAHTFTFRSSPAEPFRIAAEDREAGITGRSNRVATEKLPVPYTLLWGDLHGHSNLSDGTGTPDDYYRYARDVSGLDVSALTDHDAHGLWALDDRPDLWRRIGEVTRSFYAPGRFVTFNAYEWTNWKYGHKHVLYGDGDPAPLLSMRSPDSDTPEKLWKALEGHDAITIPHHPGGGPVPTDWEHHDPRFEPLVEICSIHGSSERWDCPHMIHRPVQGHFVVDALARGYRLGFLGSGDTHNGHPGQGDPSAPVTGLAGIFARDRSRASVLEAMRARRVFATTGARITVLFWIDDRFMGEETKLAPGAPVAYRGEVFADEPIDTVEVVKDGAVLGVARPGTTRARIEGMDPDPPKSGHGYYYIRVTQFDEEQAWSSPVFYDVR